VIDGAWSFFFYKISGWIGIVGVFFLGDSFRFVQRGDFLTDLDYCSSLVYLYGETSALDRGWERKLVTC
jgi:hypothetical protein